MAIVDPPRMVSFPLGGISLDVTRFQSPLFVCVGGRAGATSRNRLRAAELGGGWTRGVLRIKLQYFIFIYL